MRVVRIRGKITKEDVEELNKMQPNVIEISSTKGQSAEILASLDSSIKIRIRDNEEKEELKEESSKFEIIEDDDSKEVKEIEDEVVYTPQELSDVVRYFNEIEKGIDVGFSDLDAALYTYIELIKIISPINIQEMTKEDNLIDNNTLLALIKQRGFPSGYANVYKEAMKRLGIPCRIVKGDNGYAWNEIEINGQYYPLDITSDAEFYRSKEGEGKLGVCKFLTDKEFYFDPLHKTSVYSEKDLKEIRALDESEVGKSLERLAASRMKREQRPRPELKLTSKTLTETIKGGVVTQDTITELETLKITVTKEESKAIAADLAEIGKYYPEVLNTVELENNSDKPVNMQELVDAIYNSRQEAIDAGENVEPIELIISSSNEEDFNLDFSNVPKANHISNSPVDNQRKTRVVLRNNGAAVRIDRLNGKLNGNIEALDLSNFDLDGLNIEGTGITSIAIRGGDTSNADSIIGVESLSAIALEAVDPITFNSLYSQVVSSTSNVHDFSVSNVYLHDRKILEELSINPNLARISIEDCNLNDIDGLENFDGRIAYLNLARNDLGVDDIGRLSTFKKRNPHLDLFMYDNSEVMNTVNTSRELSDLSYDFIRDYLKLARNNDISTKNGALQWIFAGYSDVPYYIGDAELMSGILQNTLNPVMLERDDEIDTIDFTVPYLQNVPVLLTINQLERLIASGKRIPQDVRLNIHDVTELTADRAKTLTQDMTNLGMNLAGVQIFDRQGANERTNTNTYSMAEYVYIRETLDNVVAGIDPSEPDIDKFVTIYDRLGSKITYDNGAIRHNTFDESMYYADNLWGSRNLLNGLRDETCVCAGYADILRNALLMVGIDARYNCGRCVASEMDTGHAWNQVLLDDGTGTKKWYYTDLTWDAGKDNYNWTLLGDVNFKSHAYRDSVSASYSHDVTYTRNAEVCTRDDYDRVLLREAFARAKVRNQGYDYMNPGITIDIPEDPSIPADIPDPDRIAAEYARRKDDMFAKFYGDRDYQAEYEERNARFRDHEVERVDSNGRTYSTIEDYTERKEDEAFLLLDKYSESLERMTKFEAGDDSVYQGTPDQKAAQLERDREYVETRNHTFDQHRNTYRDLATLGKYGERMPYIQRQPGVLRNITRVVGNVGIFARNLVAPVYRAIGRYVAQPIHRLVTRGRDASPYRNNFYHRMVARRDYFAEQNEAQNPGHPIRNFIKTRVDAIVRASEGNEAVLRAGAADIRKNIVEQERLNATIVNLERRSAAFDAQIQSLQEQLRNNPTAQNADAVRASIADKISKRDGLNQMAENYRTNREGMSQTDAVSDKQHAVASKEVNTMRVTVIKGFAKGAVKKFIGPKIKDWLLERGKTTETIDVPIQEEVPKQRWVETTYKDEVVPIYEDVIDSDAKLSDIMAANEGKSVTGFFSVYGGERGGSVYNLTGNEKITAIFQAKGNGGTGLSDAAGLTAPTLTDKVFSSDLLNANGVLNQDISLNDLIDGLSSGSIDSSAFGDMYVSLGDKCWVKLSDLVGDVTKKVQIGEEIQRVVDVEGHMEEYMEIVEKIVPTTKVVTDPRIQAVVDVGGKVAKGTMVADGVIDVAENIRTTTTDTRENKSNPRNYTYDVDVDDIPRSRREYRDRER